MIGDLDTGTCRSCGAPIRWAVTAKRRRIPLDPDPGPGGNILVEDGVAVIVGTPSLLDDAPRFTSHFATCPNAARHRRRRGKGGGS